MIKTKYEGLYLKDNKTYIARFKIDNKPYKRVVGHKPDLTDRIANNKRLELIKEIKEGTPSKGVLDEVFKQYIEMRKPLISESWYYSQTKDYELHIKKPIGKKQIADITTNDIQKIINKMIASGYAPQTAKMVKDSIRKLYNELPKLGYRLYNVAADVEIPKFDNERKVNLSEDEVIKLFNEMINYPDLMYRTIYIWLLHGRRKGEVLNMRWEYIDFEHNLYTVKPDINKNKKDYEYTISDTLKEALAIYGIKNKGLVFPQKSDKNKILSKFGMDYHWKKVRKATGLENINMHDLRHVLGGFGVNKGYSLEIVGAALGHSSTRITKRYSKVRKESAAILVDDLLNTMIPPKSL